MNKAKKTASSSRRGAKCDDKLTRGQNQSYDSIRSNDIEWWNKTPLYADATRVPFNRIAGDPIDRGYGNNPTNGVLSSVRAVPGIMAIDFAPTLGTTSDANSPANRAFTSLYGAIYSKTTGAMQFQQADLALFVTSFSSIVALTGVVKRALGVAQLYSGMNYYYPRHLLTAMGVDPDSVIGHQDEVRMRLNDAVLSINALKIPDFMSVYKRQYGLCHNVYADEDNVRAQVFVFRPTGYYKYHESGETEGSLSYLSFEELDWSTPVPITSLIDKIEECLNVWRNSSDLGIISGSIQRAFSDNNLVSLDYVTGTEAVVPIVDRNISWQINNCIALPELDPTSLDITQDPVKNLIISKPKVTSVPVAAKAKNWMLNSFDGEIGPEFQMEATRLLPLLATDSDNHLRDWNTEIVVKFHMFTTYANAAGTQNLSKFSCGSALEIQNTGATAYAANKSVLEAICELSKFKHAPRIAVYQNITGVKEIHGEIGDLSTYTTIDYDALAGLNKAALQSVYQTDVPVLG